MAFVDVGAARLEVERIDVGRRDAPTIVMLHEGLGSVAMWKDFPHRVAHAANRDVLAYSRAGYGRSSPAALPYDVRYMHDEALVALPRLLDACAVERPILLGHSDGATIALIHAGASGRPVTGLALMAPHVFVEDVSIASIAQAKVAWRTTDLRARLARYHDDVDAAFTGWNDIWLDPAFRAFDIAGEVRAVRCPVLAIQGEDDEYGTMAQIERIARLAPDVDLVRLADCRHSPHRDQPEAVLEALVRFVDRLA
ncbi:MAG TPA: alpha/beta hydrolase [Casimicrobiaceae bacterium]|nr:alpha/beta hydrolase [Casimicrobiaceae bacterium]